MTVNNRFQHGGDVYGAAPEGGWRDFSANINPLGLSSRVREAIASHLDDVIHYPDPAGAALKSAVASHYGVPQKMITLGNGAAELFYVLFHMAALKSVMIPMPSFSEYERAALAAGMKIDTFAMSADNDFEPDIDGLIKALSRDKVSAIILGNPNNPTGNLIAKDDMEKIVISSRENNSLVIVDESFIDFRGDSEKYSVGGLVEKYDNLVVIHSLTKFYAMPGLRLGFAIAPVGIAQAMERGKDPWNVNLLAHHAGIAALADAPYQEATRLFVSEEKDALAERLRALGGMTVYQPTVNFILVKLDRKKWGTSIELKEKMRERGFLIRDCSNYIGLSDSFIRVAVKSRAENDELVEALSAAGGM